MLKKNSNDLLLGRAHIPPKKLGPEMFLVSSIYTAGADLVFALVVSRHVGA